MTERLYYSDCYLTSFDATILEIASDGRRVYLDRTAFYPTSGGQPHDLGTVNDVALIDVIDDPDERIAHILEAPLAAGPARGEIDWPRRFDFMQQHTGQHLLSAVFERLFGFKTLSVHFSEDSATLDLATPSLSAGQLRQSERRANEIVVENRPVTIAMEQAAGAADLRKPAAREGAIRVVTIADLDRSACGGTHVRATGEIGLVLLRKLDKIRGNVRIEFLCGLRAAARARADFDALSGIARLFSAPLDDTPALAATLNDQLKGETRTRRKLAAELAVHRGRALYDAAAPSPSGRRVHMDQRPCGTLDDEIRALAQSFTAQPGAAYLAAIDTPATLLLAVSEDAGLDAGALLKKKLAAYGGRGGGNVRVAQGSLPDSASLAALVAELRAYL